jgi:ABC-type transport system involved in cytochrome c biogenesis permease subunit
MTDSVFMYLYPLVSSLGFAGYFPQIRNLILANKAPEALSTAMWSFWLAEQFISAGYGMFHLEDFFFTLFSLLDFACLLCLLSLTLYTKHVKQYGHVTGHVSEMTGTSII